MNNITMSTRTCLYPHRRFPRPYFTRVVPPQTKPTVSRDPYGPRKTLKLFSRGRPLSMRVDGNITNGTTCSRRRFLRKKTRVVLLKSFCIDRPSSSCHPHSCRDALEYSTRVIFARRHRVSNRIVRTSFGAVQCIYLRHT